MESIVGRDDARCTTLIASRAIQFLNDNPHRALAVEGQSVFGEDSSGAIVRIKPIRSDNSAAATCSSGKLKPSIEFVQELATPYIAGIIANMAIERGTVDCKNLFRRMMTDPLMHCSAGIIFERFVHQAIKRGEEVVSNQLISGGSLQTVKRARATSFAEFASLKEVKWRVKKSLPNMKPAFMNRYLFPMVSNLATVDSFMVVQGDGGKPQVLLLQLTVGRTHAIKTAGLDELEKIVPAARNHNTWRLIFITNSSNAGLRKEQIIVGRAVSVACRKPRIFQCVWRVPDAVLWAG